MAAVAVVHSGRGSGGEERRVDSWIEIGRALGLDVAPIAFGDHPWQPAELVRRVGSLITGSRVPEALSWNPSSLLADLAGVGPGLIVAITARAFEPRLAELGVPVVADYVDRLSMSYRQRAAIAGPGQAAIFNALAWSHQRVERRVPSYAGLSTAAGRADAKALGGLWVPNTISVVPDVKRGVSPDHDLLFFGTLSYEPNIEAIRWLDSATESRRDLRVLIAGRRATTTVQRIVVRRGWTLMEDFPDVATLARRARIAVSPLRSAAGIQNKVLEAAAVAMPQIVSAAVAAGLDDAFPVIVAGGAADFTDQIDHLLGNHELASQLGSSGRLHVKKHYSAEAVAAGLASGFAPLADLASRVATRPLSAYPAQPMGGT
ncbi:MAG: glycosyltransferase [Actinomycetia bacterium]|nr:glycosyltransferase [Actinomycetes bacterium]